MLEKLFGFDPSKMTLRKEVIGGIPHVSRL